MSAGITIRPASLRDISEVCRMIADHALYERAPINLEGAKRVLPRNHGQSGKVFWAKIRFGYRKLKRFLGPPYQQPATTQAPDGARVGGPRGGIRLHGAAQRVGSALSPSQRAPASGRAWRGWRRPRRREQNRSVSVCRRPGSREIATSFVIKPWQLPAKDRVVAERTPT